jgi:hypothetical protein
VKIDKILEARMQKFLRARLAHFISQAPAGQYPDTIEYT